MERQVQEILPAHVQQAVDEAWAICLEREAATWKAARRARGSVDHAGVYMARPHGRSILRVPRTLLRSDASR